MAFTLNYGMLGEIERLTGGDLIARPRVTRGRQGRWDHDHAGESDWYYSLSERERSYISQRYMSSDHGVEIDVLATMAGMDIDAWADAFVAAVRASRDRTLATADVLSDEWGEAADSLDMSGSLDNVVSPSDLLSTSQIAELLEVREDTVQKWRIRGLLPEPWGTWPFGSLWQRSTVETWAAETGRLPEHQD